MFHARFFGFDGRFHEADVVVVDKSEINPMFDTYIASIEMDDGVYFEIYNVDGELHGFWIEA